MKKGKDMIKNNKMIFTRVYVVVVFILVFYSEFSYEKECETKNAVEIREKENVVTGSIEVSSENFSVIEVLPGKVFSPSGDNWNSVFRIKYDNPGDAVITARIYDMRGRYVSAMDNNSIDSYLSWDGLNDADSTQSGGVYIYQIEISGYEYKVISGTIVLAR